MATLEPTTSQQATRGRAAQASPRLEYSIETVTPVLAHEWLGANTHNRRLSRAQVDRFARDMAAGAWKFTADPIRFNGQGTLIDGQHRLHACIKAERPFDALVIRNMPMDIQEKLDQGKMRNVGDHLMLRDAELPSPAMIGATARQLIAIKDGVMEPQRNTRRPTNSEVLAIFDKHPDIAESVRAIGKSVIGVHPSIIAAMHYVGAHLLHDRDTADSFVSVFATGEPAYTGDPAHLWRERLIAQQTKNARMRRSSIRIGTIHAWNLFRRKETLRLFRLPEDTSAIEGLDVNLI